MTDRIIGLQVTFDGPIREDDAERLVELVRLIVAVGDVRPIYRNICAEDIAERRVKKQLLEKVHEVLG